MPRQMLREKVRSWSPSYWNAAMPGMSPANKHQFSGLAKGNFQAPSKISGRGRKRRTV